MLENYKTIEVKSVFNGKRCAVNINIVIKDKKTYQFEVVHVKNVVAIVLVDKYTKKIVLNENTRYPVGERFLELIAGQIEPGQSAEDAAKVEIVQESGYVVDEITRIGEYFTSPGLLTEKCTIFFAQGHKTGTKSLEEMEDLENKQFSNLEIAKMLHKGQIYDLKTALGLSLFLGCNAFNAVDK